jgi:hypothetical protein
VTLNDATQTARREELGALDARAPRIIARELLLRVADTADRYALHAALDARWGRRGEVGYLWCPGRVSDGAAVRVRLPVSHPDGSIGAPLEAPVTGAMLRFRLRANITHKDGRSGHRRSWKREEIMPRMRWLERRATEHGFRVDEVNASVARVFIQKDKGFWLDETIFTGRLTVVDADRFAAALAGGVGQRPAFGFGLLETF